MSIKRDLMKDKLFDAKSYNTVYISIEDEQKVRHEQMEILVELLCDPKNKSLQTQVYDLLKKERKAVELLIHALEEAKGDKKRLVAVCWEANIDCNEYIDTFAGIVLKDDFSVAMEALTVIEHMTDIPATKVIEWVDKVKAAYSADNPKAPLYMDLIELLRRWE